MLKPSPTQLSLVVKINISATDDADHLLPDRKRATLGLLTSLVIGLLSGC
jgi:hypothetical protein